MAIFAIPRQYTGNGRQKNTTNDMVFFVSLSTIKSVNHGSTKISATMYISTVTQLLKYASTKAARILITYMGKQPYYFIFKVYQSSNPFPLQMGSEGSRIP